MEYTASADFSRYQPLSLVSNFGCEEDDWINGNTTIVGRVVLVKRGFCTFIEKAALAIKYNALALLIYNDGTDNDRKSPLFVTLGRNNTIPGLFLSYELGQNLADSLRTNPDSVRVLLNVRRIQDASITASNVCADTPTGDPTKTIVIGSHSDSVPAGPGINDNGKQTKNICFLIVVCSSFI